MGVAAQILRQARNDADITLRELARRTGVAESHISGYEHGRHQPSAEMLQRLLDGTGHDLTAVLKRRPGIDQRRNGDVLISLLSFNDAVPFAAARERAGLEEPLPTFRELTRR